MDALQAYGGGSDSEHSDDDVTMKGLAAGKSATLGSDRQIVSAPVVESKSAISHVAIIDPKTKEIKSNPRYDQLFQPEKQMDEMKKWQEMMSLRFKKEKEDQMAEKSITLHLKEADDYQGRSFLVPPSFTGVNLREDYCPERCFVPKKLVHTYRGHNKGVNYLQWFPKSSHLFLSCSMDNDRQRVVRTYSGHKLPVREVAFNNEGTEFLSASLDRYVKLWNIDAGQLRTGHVPYGLKYHTDDDEKHMFLVRMQNNKNIMWDSRSGQIFEERDCHLQAVKSISFFDKNRRFASTSDDKSVRIWEPEIPVDTKLIQNVELHAIPTMTKSPNDDNETDPSILENELTMEKMSRRKPGKLSKVNEKGADAGEGE